MTFTMAFRRFASVVEAMIDLVLPPFCVLCGPLVPADAATSLCESCRSSIDWFDVRRQCVVCARPLEVAIDGDRRRCGPCRRSRPPWNGLAALAPYDGRLKDVIVKFKYGGTVSLAAGLAQEVADRAPRILEAVGAVATDLIVPMPLEPSRAASRGFNQSELIAARLDTALGIPFEGRGLSRRRGTSQVGKSASERRELEASDFTASRFVWGRRILLVDDVLTTGGTMRAAAKALLKAGALGVVALVLARTPDPGSQKKSH